MSETNKYLKSSISQISNFYRNNTQPPEDMYENLLMELRFSELLMPVVFDGEHLSFPHIEVDDGTKLLPLFTSDDELKKYSEDFDRFANDIEYYVKLVGDFGFDGILIDLKSDELCIDNAMLKKIPRSHETRKNRGLDPSRLREMALAEKNVALRSFIKDPSNFNRYDEISRLLVDSLILNVVVSEEDLSEIAEDGIISRDDSFTFTLYTKKSGRDHYGVVYTDTDAIVSFHETLKYHYYVQVTNKHRVFDFILSNGMDGIIINPGTDEYYVPRQVLLRLFSDDLLDERLENATRYAFLIE